MDGNTEVGELHPRPGYDPDTSAPPSITLGAEGSIRPAVLTRVSYTHWRTLLPVLSLSIELATARREDTNRDLIDIKPPWMTSPSVNGR